MRLKVFFIISSLNLIASASGCMMFLSQGWLSPCLLIGSCSPPIPGCSKSSLFLSKSMGTGSPSTDMSSIIQSSISSCLMSSCLMSTSPLPPRRPKMSAPSVTTKG
ncbi:hypothetical protein F5Y08DRAFT_309915 [Xylaria arbuscula]|nr:hypothetical protein F5Y08DRAFT_309915 [Xylaria arbuscula]